MMKQNTKEYVASTNSCKSTSSQNNSENSSNCRQSIAFLKSIKALGKSAKGQNIKILQQTTTNSARDFSEFETTPSNHQYQLKRKPSFQSLNHDSMNDFSQQLSGKLSLGETDIAISKKLNLKCANERIDDSNNESCGIESGWESNDHQILTSKNKEAKTFYVKILKDKFEPNFLKIELGSVVQWNIDSDLHKKEDCQNEIYQLRKRYHVISFDKINEESDPLTSPCDTFIYQFNEPGLFQYKCQVFTRMKGVIQVQEKEQKKFNLFYKPIQKQSKNNLSKNLLKYSDENSFKNENFQKERFEQSNSKIFKKQQKFFDNEDNRIHIDTEAPLINKNFFKEIFESERGSKLIIHEAQISSESEDEEHKQKDQISESDEESYIKQSRKCFKLTKTLKTGQVLQPICESISNKSRSMSNNSSIEELKAKGYLRFKAKVKQTDQIIEQQKEIGSSAEDAEDDTASEGKFWRKYTNNDADEINKSPKVYDKFTFQKFSEFSRMLHSTTNSGGKKRGCSKTDFDFQTQINKQENNEILDNKIYQFDQISANDNEIQTCSEFSHISSKFALNMKISESDQSSIFCNNGKKRETESDYQFSSRKTKITDLNSQIQLSSNKDDSQIKLIANLNHINQCTKNAIIDKNIVNKKSTQDDQSELDELAAIQKQRQNQKKKLRKKNKKKQEENKDTNLNNDIIQFDRSLDKCLLDNLINTEEKFRLAEHRYLDKIEENIYGKNLIDEFILGNVVEYLQDRFKETNIKIESF